MDLDFTISREDSREIMEIVLEDEIPENSEGWENVPLTDFEAEFISVRKKEYKNGMSIQVTSSYDDDSIKVDMFYGPISIIVTKALPTGSSVEPTFTLSSKYASVTFFRTGC